MGIALLLALAGVVGCDGGGGTGTGGGSCSASSSCTTNNGNGCVETNLSASLAQQACPASSGTFASSPCSRTGAVGGCRTMNTNTCTTTWYYTTASAPVTISQVQQICDASHGTVVSP